MQKTIKIAIFSILAALTFVAASSLSAMADTGDEYHQENFVPYPLLHATLHDDIAEVNRLIAAGADVNAADKDGITALSFAVYNEQTEVAKMLIAAGADVNAADKDGGTALHDAALKVHAEIVAILLAAGADVKLVDKNGATALMVASGKTISELQDKLRDPALESFFRIVYKHDLEVALIRANAGQFDTMKLLLSVAAEKNYLNASDNFGWTALMYAAKTGSANATRLLIEHGADVNLANADGWTALDLAEDGGDRGVARILRKAGAN